MFDQVLSFLQQFLGRKLGKSVAGIGIVFGLGVFAAYTLPQWLVTVDYLNAEVIRIMEDSRKSDDWQELNLTELRREMLQRQLWDLEDRVDGKGILTLKQQNRLNFLTEDLNKINNRMDILKNRLQRGREKLGGRTP